MSEALGLERVLRESGYTTFGRHSMCTFKTFEYQSIAERYVSRDDDSEIAGVCTWKGPVPRLRSLKSASTTLHSGQLPHMTHFTMT